MGGTQTRGRLHSRQVLFTYTLGVLLLSLVAGLTLLISLFLSSHLIHNHAIELDYMECSIW